MRECTADKQQELQHRFAAETAAAPHMHTPAQTEQKAGSHLVDGVAGLAACHDVVHHALEQLERGQGPRADGQHILQGLLQQISVEL